MTDVAFIRASLSQPRSTQKPGFPMIRYLDRLDPFGLLYNFGNYFSAVITSVPTGTEGRWSRPIGVTPPLVKNCMLRLGQNYEES
jgi:hypothetical protein